MTRPVVYEADLAWDGRSLRPGVLAVDAAGRVAPPGSLPATTERVPLPGRALLPGLVNAHSHAFQRLLRGRTERAPGGARDDFWTWRERMYAIVQRLTPQGLYAAARQAFLEMALAGVTMVGEFHYLQHDPEGLPYAEPGTLALEVIRAARDVGLRVVLLNVGYARAGFQLPPDPRQRRFYQRRPEDWLQATETLRDRVRSDPLVTVGLAPHSVRALPRSWLEMAKGFPAPAIHMHLAEQAAEVEACLAEHGRRPVELVDEVGLLNPRFTAVHAIHVTAAEIGRLGKAGAGVCACPSTERDLADGVVPADALAQAGVSLSLGSDSQVLIDLLDEARQLEGHLRLLRGRREVLASVGAAPASLGARLLDIATVGGARALGLSTGSLEPGHPADFFTVDLNHPALAGWEPGTVLATLFTGGGATLVREVAVDGRLIVQGGRHPDAEACGRAFGGVMKETFG